jgi:sugar phosphate isomerase/epimerase
MQFGTQPRRGLETPLGQGDVAWADVFNMLEESDYQGWLTINRTQGEDRRRDVARAVAYLQNMLRS